MKYGIYPEGSVSSLFSRVVTCPPEWIQNQLTDGETYLEVPNSVDDSTHFVLQNSLVALPPSPGITYVFDTNTLIWVDARTLEELKREASRLINDWRNTQENTEVSFEFNGRTWDCGQATASRMLPSVRATELPADFFWTDYFNNRVYMDKADLMALSAAHDNALIARGFLIHARQRDMKDSLAEMDKAGLAAFVPGWPEDV